MPRQAVGDQAGDLGAAGVVRTEDLSQEDPEGDPGRKDPVQPAGDGGQRPGKDLLRPDVGERQVAVLQELPPQETHLLAEGWAAVIKRIPGPNGGNRTEWAKPPYPINSGIVLP